METQNSNNVRQSDNNCHGYCCLPLPILDTDFFANDAIGNDKGQAVLVGNTWTNIILSSTGESLNYEVVTKWIDGLAMQDNKVDGYIYRKRGSEYLKLVFNGVLNIKWFGAVCDGTTDDSVAFQNSICVAQSINAAIDITGQSIMLKKGLIVTEPVRIVGSMRQTNIYASLPDNEILFDITKVNGFVLDGATIKGENTFDLFNLKNVTDSSFSNMRIMNFRKNLISTYSYCILFSNVRFQSSVRPMELNSQSNNMEFNRCSFVTFSQAMTFINCEGLNFTSCEFANFGNYVNSGNVGRSWASLYQSQMSVINPYYENIGGAHIAIGADSEVLRSVFTSIGGKCTDKSVNIMIQSSNERLFLKSLNRNARFCIDTNFINTGRAKYLTILENDGQNGNILPSDIMVRFTGREKFPFGAYGNGASNTNEPYSISSKLLTVGVALTGIVIAPGNLIIDEYYTLIYAIRKQSDNELIIRHGLAAVNLPINEFDEEIELRYIPFKANSEWFSLFAEFANSKYEIKHLSLIKGNVLPDLTPADRIESKSAPNQGSWSTGDFVFNVGNSEFLGWRFNGAEWIER